MWDAISESQELGLPPFVYNLYKDVIVTAYKDKNGEPEGIVKIGLARQDIIKSIMRFMEDFYLLGN